MTSINSNYSQFYKGTEPINSYGSGTVQKTSVEKTESKLSDKAQKYLDELRKQYGNYDFIIADRGDDYKGLLKQSSKEISVVLSSEELEKMANDENYASEKMRNVKTIERMTGRIMDEYGFESAWGKDNNGGIEISKITVSVDDDGKMKIFSELERASEKRQEQMDKIREKRADDKKAAEKKAKKAEADEDRKNHSKISFEIEADSEEDFIRKLRERVLDI